MPKSRPRRSLLLNVPPEQEAVLLPFYAACGVTLICLLFLVAADNPFLQSTLTSRDILHSKTNAFGWHRILPGVLAVTVFCLLMCWAYFTTSRAAGAYNRIVTELDGILAGERKGPLRVRDKDDLMAGLVQRINILLELRRESPARRGIRPRW